MEDSSTAIAHRGPLEVHFFLHRALVTAESSFGFYFRVRNVDAIFRAFSPPDLAARTRNGREVHACLYKGLIAKYYRTELETPRGVHGG